MIDSFSSACDSARNFFRRRWRWVVGALILYFIFGNYLAVFLGYAETVTETVIENGKSVDKKTTSWLSPGARLLRDLFIAIAAVLGITMAGWRNFALDRQSKAASEQAKNDSDRIAGEQFSDAVKLLAQKDAENKPAIDARIGGIYSLQTLANNRIKEYGAQVVKTLISYIKQNAQLTAQQPLKENETQQKARVLGEDVKTAFNVLEQLLSARKGHSAEWNKLPDGIKLSDEDLSFSGQDFSWLDLSLGQVGGLFNYAWHNANLQNVNLSEAQLQKVDLNHAELRNANLSEADAQGARLYCAQMQNADLSFANMNGADLSGAEMDKAKLLKTRLHKANLLEAKMRSADLSRAHLHGANLWFAEMQGANLLRAQLQGADLSVANLQGANLLEAELQYADLSLAKMDGQTKLPADLSGEIWHSGQPKFRNIKQCLPDADWDLAPFLHSTDALVGVLQNYALKHKSADNDSVMRARKLRLATRKLLDEKKLSEDFPKDWRDWLAEVKPDGSHPDDLKHYQKIVEVWEAAW